MIYIIIFVILCFYICFYRTTLFYLQKEIKIKASDESCINQIVEGNSIYFNRMRIIFISCLGFKDYKKFRKDPVFLFINFFTNYIFYCAYFLRDKL